MYIYAVVKYFLYSKLLFLWFQEYDTLEGKVGFLFPIKKNDKDNVGTRCLGCVLPRHRGWYGERRRGKRWEAETATFRL